LIVALNPLRSWGFDCLAIRGRKPMIIAAAEIAFSDHILCGIVPPSFKLISIVHS
jgi:hypothetical protein